MTLVVTRSLPADTAPDAALRQFARWRQMSGAERMQGGFELSRSVRERLLSGLEFRHPDAARSELRGRLLRILFPSIALSGDVAMPENDASWPGQDKLLLAIAAKLAECDIAYMVSGSVGANFHGEPRATNDIDIVIDPTRAQLDRFLASLDEQYYVSPETARSALERRSMFNIIDTASSWKVDLIVRKNRPFSEVEFQRRATIEFQGNPLSIVSAEDSLLSKLEWAHRSGSDRQLRDAESIARVQSGELDAEYLKQWAAELGIERQLQATLDAASRPLRAEPGD